MPAAPIWNLDAELAAGQALRGDLQPLLNLIASHAWFPDPLIARAVPVVFPRTARIVEGKHRVGDVVRGIRLWTNQPAREAVFRALGLRYQLYNGAAVCHIYPGSPRLPAHFTRLANLVIVPIPLAAFTELGPVLEALKWRAFELYGYRGPGGRVPGKPDFLPARWATPSPLDPEKRERVIAKLKHTRATRPTFSRATSVRQSVIPWKQGPGARDLAEEFVRDLMARPPVFATTLGWFVRHAYFAPPRVVAACPNPLPGHRRPRRGGGAGIRWCCRSTRRRRGCCTSRWGRTATGFAMGLWITSMREPPSILITTGT